MNRSGSLPVLVVGVLVVAALAIFLVKGGWLIGIPALLALAVVGVVFWTPRR